MTTAMVMMPLKCLARTHADGLAKDKGLTAPMFIGLLAPSVVVYGETPCIKANFTDVPLRRSTRSPFGSTIVALYHATLSKVA